MDQCIIRLPNSIYRQEKVAAAAKNNLERPQTELALRAIPDSKKSKLLQINLFFKEHSDKYYHDCGNSWHN